MGAREMIDEGLSERLDAAQTWAQLTGPERERVVTYVGHGLPGVGRRRRAKRMLLFLGFGPESVRGFFGPLQRLPKSTVVPGPETGPQP